MEQHKLPLNYGPTQTSLKLWNNTDSSKIMEQHKLP